MNNGYETKQDKFFTMLSCISVLIFELFLSCIIILFFIQICSTDIALDNIIGLSISLIWAFVFALIILCIGIRIIYSYRFQRDIYTESKLIRKRKEKIIFELSYTEIVSVKTGFHSIYLFCKQPIMQSNGKKGPKTIYEHYSENDIRKIKQIISESNYNLSLI